MERSLLFRLAWIGQEPCIRFFCTIAQITPEIFLNRPVRISTQSYVKILNLEKGFFMRPERYLSIDLHGLSVAKTKELLKQHFDKVAEDKITEFIIITGRGKHIAPD